MYLCVAVVLLCSDEVVPLRSQKAASFEGDWDGLLWRQWLCPWLRERQILGYEGKAWGKGLSMEGRGNSFLPRAFKTWALAFKETMTCLENSWKIEKTEAWLPGVRPWAKQRSDPLRGSLLDLGLGFRLGKTTYLAASSDFSLGSNTIPLLLNLQLSN